MPLQQGTGYDYDADDNLYGCVYVNSPADVVQHLAAFLCLKGCQLHSIAPGTSKKYSYQWAVRLTSATGQAPKASLVHGWLRQFDPQPVSVLTAQITSLREQVKALESAVGQASVGVSADAEAQLAALHAENTSLRTASEQAAQRITNLESALEKTRADREEAKLTAENAQRELAAERRKLNDQPERLEQLTVRNAQLQARLADEQRKSATLAQELQEIEALKARIEHLKGQVTYFKAVNAAEKANADRRINEANSKLVRLYDDLEEDKSFYLQQIDVLESQLRGKRPKQPAAPAPVSPAENRQIEESRAKINALEQRYDDLQEEKLRLFKRVTQAKQHELEFTMLLEDLRIETGTTSEAEQRRLKAALNPTSDDKHTTHAHPRSFEDGLAAVRQTIHSLRDKLTHLSQMQADAPLLLDAASAAPVLGKTERMRIAFETLLPRVTLLRDSVDRMAEGVVEPRWVLEEIVAIVIGKVLPKPLAGADGWCKVNYSNGQDDSGRLYVRIGKGANKDHYDVLVSIKETQEPDIQYLKKQ